MLLRVIFPRNRTEALILQIAKEENWHEKKIAWNWITKGKPILDAFE